MEGQSRARLGPVWGDVQEPRSWNRRFVELHWEQTFLGGLEMTNREFSKTDKRFVEACEDAEVKPTVRQASKWRRKKGKAWKWGGTQYEKA